MSGATSATSDAPTRGRDDKLKEADASPVDGEDPDVDDDEEDDDDQAKAKGVDGENENDESAGAQKGDGDDKKSTKKSRRELPPHTVAILKGWMLSPEHVKHPYPTDEDKQMLLKKTGINMKQLTNWFTNARKRIWKPMMRREHSRQLQNAMEYDKVRGRDGYYGPPGMAPSQYPDGAALPPRAAVRHSFDAGSLGPPREHMVYDQQYAPHGRPDGPEMAYSVIPQGAYPPRPGRSISESSTHSEMDEYLDAMRIRKRVHVGGPGDVDVDAMGPEKRLRRSAIMSPRSLKVLQDWVASRAHTEYPPFPSDSEKLQLSRETGLDVQQIEMWFKNNRDRIGAVNYQGHPAHPSLSPSHQQQAGGRMTPMRSIPSRDNPQFPPPPYERRSIPSSGNSMFPPRPTVVRSSVPGANNPQFPPPPGARRELGEKYRGDVQYQQGLPASGQYGYDDGSPDPRPMRSLSINAGGQYMRPAERPPSSTGLSNGGPGSVLPSLSSRNLLSRPSSGPTMGQPRDGRSHTLDMGLFTEARRRKMNFADILASTPGGNGNAPNPSPAAPTPQRPSLGPPDFNRAPGHHQAPSANSENVYPNSTSTYSTHKGFERDARNGTGCAECGAPPNACGCAAGNSACGVVDQSRIV
ncbi:TPA: hypothetical protein N0F65_002890 [Lagenidium giganteum]|uniref:Homeobox domain-containing protein n=1 Tax=Lagenidium giganteum TaxID=4803 RepID=A0AAV2ZD43_9STRA|nr:TPA: hypothetical protein N0F65_002890 [Lagenidium giganteum]